MAVTFPQNSDDTQQGLLTVKWNPSSTDSPGSCPADEYVVGYELINRDQCLKEAESPINMYDSVTTTEVTLAGLVPYSTYKIYVTARNDEGDADQSSREIITAAESECIHVSRYLPSGQFMIYLSNLFLKNCVVN